MNKIIYVGKIQSDGKKVNKCYEVIIPSAKGTGGMLVAKGFSARFDADEIAVIPSGCKYTLSGAHPEDLHLLIEQCTLSLREPAVITDVENDGIRRAAEQAEIFINAGGAGDAVISALGNLIVSYIGLYSDGLPPVIKSVRGEIDRHVSDPTFSLEQYLKSLPLNSDYVRKLFKEKTGVSPHAYLYGKRMDLAQILLSSHSSNKYSEYSVAQLAEACGFADPLYFSRAFKKQFGLSPTEYKNKPLTE